MRKTRLLVALALLGTSALALGAGDVFAQTATKAGVAAAVRGPVQQVSFRTPAATVGRNVASGDEIFLGDRIVTGPAGGLQILLLDGTALSMGPNSSVVIDEFVFNPAEGTGKLAASIASGTLRVISGRLGRQENEPIVIKTPVATVGVRGTISIFANTPQGWLIALLGVGPDNSINRPGSYLVVQTSTGLQLLRMGWGCTIAPASAVCNARPLTPELLRAILDFIGPVTGDLRGITVEQLELLTGLAKALNVTLDTLLQSLMDYEKAKQDGVNQFQDQFRPPNFTPPPSQGFGN